MTPKPRAKYAAKMWPSLLHRGSNFLKWSCGINARSPLSLGQKQGPRCEAEAPEVTQRWPRVGPKGGLFFGDSDRW